MNELNILYTIIEKEAYKALIKALVFIDCINLIDTTSLRKTIFVTRVQKEYEDFKIFIQNRNDLKNKCEVLSTDIELTSISEKNDYLINSLKKRYNIFFDTFKR